MIKASIIIPTYNNADSLATTLDTLILQDHPSNEYEIIIVDNGSTDHTKIISTAKIIKYANHRIYYYLEPEPGNLAARHYGVFKSVGELLIFIDDDIEAERGWLNAIVNTFQDPTIQLVGGKNLPRFEVAPPSWLEYFYKTKYGGYTCGFLSLLDFGEEIIDINPNYIWTLNFSIRRKAFYELRGFHPNIYPSHLQHYQGDGEYGLTSKAQAKGYRAVYQPKASVYHRIPASRLTPEHFERRAFFQGVGASFTQIRNSNIKEYIDIKQNRNTFILYLINSIVNSHSYIRKNVGILLGKGGNKSEIKIRARMWYASCLGFKFHQTAVKRSNYLLDWVLKKDYWDYMLTSINPPETKIGEKYRQKYTYYSR